MDLWPKRTGVGAAPLISTREKRCAKSARALDLARGRSPSCAAPQTEPDRKEEQCDEELTTNRRAGSWQSVGECHHVRTCRLVAAGG